MVRRTPVAVLLLTFLAGSAVPTHSSPAALSRAQLAVAAPVRSTVQLTLVSVDGLSIRRLTDTPGAVSSLACLTRGTGIFLLPMWAPDGAAIAFIAIRSGDLAVTVVRPDGSGERRLLSTTGDLTGLPLFAWQPR